MEPTIYMSGTTPQIVWEFSVLRPDRTRVTGLTTTELDCAIFGPDDLEDSTTETFTELGNGVYRTFMDLADFASGFGSYILIPTSTDADHVFEPNAGQVILNVHYFQVTAVTDASNFTAGTFYPTYSGSFNRAFVKMLSGNRVNETVALQSFTGGTGAVVVATAFSGVVAVNDLGMIFTS